MYAYVRGLFLRGSSLENVYLLSLSTNPENVMLLGIEEKVSWVMGIHELG